MTWKWGGGAVVEYGHPFPLVDTLCVHNPSVTLGGFPSSARLSFSPSLYVCPFPETFPKNGRGFPGLPADPPSFRPALSLLSCHVILLVTPTHNRPRSVAPYHLPYSDYINFAFGLYSARIYVQVEVHRGFRG